MYEVAKDIWLLIVFVCHTSLLTILIDYDVICYSNGVNLALCQATYIGAILKGKNEFFLDIFLKIKECDKFYR